MAQAVELASGSARVQLEGLLRQIEAVGAKEPAKDRPLVKQTLLETQALSPAETLYVYRISSDVPGIHPITARLWLSKEGNTWHVSKFV